MNKCIITGLVFICLIVCVFTVSEAGGPVVASRIYRTPFANLGTPANDAVRYCTDCLATSPCTGGGSGATAARVNGAWNCSNGGSTVPGGSNTQVQFNDSSAFGGDAGLVYNKTTDTLTAGTLNLTNVLGATYGGTGVANAATMTSPNTNISVSGTVFVSSSGANSGTGETDLTTYTLPANALNTDGKTLRITTFGSLANNANAKTVKVYFGSTAISTLPATIANTGTWAHTGYVIRTGAATQNAWVRGGVTNGSSENANSNTVTAPTETLSGTVVIKVTGQSNTASNDVLLKGFIVEILN